MAYWAVCRRRTLEEQLRGWETEYLEPWPELVAKQVADYASQGLDWRTIARERVFPHLPSWVSGMARARQNVLRACEPTYARAQRCLGFGFEAVLVIHVGIGCGAGWATTFDGEPAVLLGMEGIVQHGWTGIDAIQGLLTHEIGHLVLRAWRLRAWRQEQGSVTTAAPGGTCTKRDSRSSANAWFSGPMARTRRAVQKETGGSRGA